MHLKMKILIQQSVFLILSLSSYLFAEPTYSGNVNLFLGAKALDTDFWGPLDEQAQVGFIIDWKKSDWPLSIAIDLLASSENQLYYDRALNTFFDVEGSTTELNVGIRKIWDDHPTARPYVGGGIAFIHAMVSLNDGAIKISDDNSGTGFWINFGVYWTLADSFNIGFDFRYSQARAELFGFTGDIGGGHAGFLLGYSW